MYELLNNYHTDTHLNLEFSSGGEQRSARGALVENLVKKAWESNGQNYVAKCQDKHTIPVGGEELQVGCDVDLYKDGTLVGIVECKAYLDKCYLERAITDFRYLEKLTKVPKFIVSLQDAIAPKTLKILKAVHEDVLAEVFFLVPSKRNSAKPLYKKEFFEPLCKERVAEFSQYLRSL